MTKFENAILDFLKKHLLFIIAAVFTAFAVWARRLSFINVGVYLIFTMAELRHSFGRGKIRSEA